MTNLALIGAGKWGKNYLSTVENIPDCQIKYTRTRDFQDLLEKDDIDGVIIATPASTHYEIASQFLQKDFNLLIEKPVTLRLDEAEKLLELCKGKRLKVLVGLTYLYNQNYLDVKKRLREIGEIKEMRFEGLSSPIRDDVNVLWDWGPHVVSLFADLAKSPITEARFIGQTDKGTLQINFQNGIKAVATMSWTHPEKIRTLNIIGEKGSLNVDFSQPTPKPPLTLEVEAFIKAIKEEGPILADINLGVEVTRTLSSIDSNSFD